jgi:hypothetical protein
VRADPLILNFWGLLKYCYRGTSTQVAHRTRIIASEPRCSWYPSVGFGGRPIPVVIYLSKESRILLGKSSPPNFWRTLTLASICWRKLTTGRSSFRELWFWACSFRTSCRWLRKSFKGPEKTFYLGLETPVRVTGL